LQRARALLYMPLAVIIDSRCPPTPTPRSEARWC
jgi:hypothetical protein